MRPADTSPDAWEVQLRIWRRMAPEQRLALALQMSDEARALTEAGVRRRHPQWSEPEVRAEVTRLAGLASGGGAALRR